MEEWVGVLGREMVGKEVVVGREEGGEEGMVIVGVLAGPVYSSTNVDNLTDGGAVVV